MVSTKVLVPVLVVLLIIVGAVAYSAGLQGASSTKTATTTQVLTTTSTKTISIVTTVTNLRAGATLVNYSGSGDAKSPPFTATTSSVKITLTVSSSSPSYSGVSWLVYELDASVYMDQGRIDGKVGTFYDYSYNLTPGVTYYVKVHSANAFWIVVIEEVK